MSAFYDDGTGLCYWCTEVATAEFFGLPLCDEHYAKEMQDMGFYGQ